MAAFGRTSTSGSLQGSLQSYGRELRRWIGGITTRYAIALVLLFSGCASIIAAIGVGIAALFHWLEVHYGANHAYAIIAGLLIFLGLVGALTGYLLLTRPLPPLPRPARHAKAIGRSVAADAMLAASAPHKALVKADPATEVMIGLAAACLVGWLLSSRMNPRTKAESR